MSRVRHAFLIINLLLFSQLVSAQATSSTLTQDAAAEAMIAAEMAQAELAEGVTITPHRGPASVRSCSVSCGGFASVKVDVKAKCMCIGSKCISVDIGKHGLKQTTNGSGTMGLAKGDLYHTYPGPGLTSLNRGNKRDDDAISMGIPLNDVAGKWIHKSRGCGSDRGGTAGGRQNTSGCIAIPCAHWPLVKSQMGKSLTVCNANNERWPPPKEQRARGSSPRKPKPGRR